MLLQRKLAPKLPCLRLLCFIAFISTQSVFAQNKSNKPDSLPYPIQDRRGDFISTDQRTFDLNKPSNITDSVAYDPVTKRYYVYEKIGSKYYRTPTWYTSDEFMAIQGRKSEIEYFKKRGNTLKTER